MYPFNYFNYLRSKLNLLKSKCSPYYFIFIKYVIIGQCKYLLRKFIKLNYNENLPKKCVSCMFFKKYAAKY